MSQLPPGKRDLSIPASKVASLRLQQGNGSSHVTSQPSTAAGAKGSYTPPPWAMSSTLDGNGAAKCDTGASTPSAGGSSFPPVVELEVVKDGVVVETLDLGQLAKAGASSSALRQGGICLGSAPKSSGQVDVECLHPSVSKRHAVLQLGCNPAAKGTIHTGDSFAPTAPVTKQNALASALAGGTGTGITAVTHQQGKSASADVMLGMFFDDSEDEDEEKHDTGGNRVLSGAADSEPSFVHLYDLGSSNGTFLGGRRTDRGEGAGERLPPRTYHALKNGEVFRLALSSRVYRVSWSFTPVDLKTASQGTTDSRKRRRTRDEEGDEEEEEDPRKLAGEKKNTIAVSYSDFVTHKQKLAEDGFRSRQQFDEKDDEFDRASAMASLLREGITGAAEDDQDFESWSCSRLLDKRKSLTEEAVAIRSSLKPPVTGTSTAAGGGSSAPSSSLTLAQERRMEVINAQLNAIEGAVQRLMQQGLQ